MLITLGDTVLVWQWRNTDRSEHPTLFHKNTSTRFKQSKFGGKISSRQTNIYWPVCHCKLFVWLQIIVIVLWFISKELIIRKTNRNILPHPEQIQLQGWVILPLRIPNMAIKATIDQVLVLHWKLKTVYDTTFAMKELHYWFSRFLSAALFL